MASIVLGTVGAVLGSFVGSPQIGWAIGSALGGALSGKSGIDSTQEGPRITDLAVQQSTWGNFIPIVYGCTRLAGNVIWSTDIIETKNTTTTSSGGKGGGGTQTQTYYTYSVDLAIGICKGPIVGINRIWIMGQIVYNASETTDTATSLLSSTVSDKIQVYTGSETQLPDSTIELKEGVGNVPAYRGLSYIVFTGLNLDKYGNRIPNIEVEVIVSGTLNTFPQVIPFTNTVSPFIDKELYNPALGYNPGYVSSYIQGTNIYTVSDIYNDREGLTTGLNLSLFDFNLNYISSTPINISSLVALSSPTIEQVQTPKNAKAIILTQIVDYSGISTILHTFRFIKIDTTGTIIKFSGNFSYSDYLINNQPNAGYSDIAGYQMVVVSNEWWVGVHSIDGNLWIAIHGCDEDGLVTDIILPSEYILATGIYTVYQPTIYVDQDGIFYIYYLETISIGKLIKFTINSDRSYNIINTYTLPAVESNKYIQVYNNTILLNYTNMYELNSDGTTTLIGSTGLSGTYPILFNQPVLGRTVVYYNTYPTSYAALVSWNRNNCSSGSILLSTLVSSLLQEVGIPSINIDVSQLIDISVQGYSISRLSSASSIITQLAELYNFRIVESDLGFKAILLSNISTITNILYDDLINNSGELITIGRTQEVDIPNVISINYFNKLSDYTIATETISRNILTTKTASISKVIENTIVLPSNEAKNIISTILYKGFANRLSFNFETSAKYSYLEPCDLLYITSANDISYLVRIVSKKEDESRRTIQWTAISEELTVYQQTDNILTTNRESSSLLELPPKSILKVLDLPSIFESAVDTSLCISVTAGSSNWRGAGIFYKLPNESYINPSSTVESSTIGITTSTLDTWTGGNIPDEVNSVTVIISKYSPLLSSQTEPNYMKYNRALVGTEIIAFRDATLVDTNTYKLSGLIRGIKDSTIYTHVIGEQFVFLGSFAGISKIDNLTIGNTITLSAISFGNNLGSESEVITTITNKVYKPLSVVHLFGIKKSTGDFLITWERQSRGSFGWDNNVDAPLSETLEAYTIEIYSDSAYTTLINTYNSSTKSYTYTTANQIIDFGSIRSSIYIKVYQQSTKVGLGNPRSLTI